MTGIAVDKIGYSEGGWGQSENYYRMDDDVIIAEKSNYNWEIYSNGKALSEPPKPVKNNNLFFAKITDNTFANATNKGYVIKHYSDNSIIVEKVKENQ